MSVGLDPLRAPVHLPSSGMQGREGEEERGSRGVRDHVWSRGVGLWGSCLPSTPLGSLLPPTLPSLVPPPYLAYLTPTFTAGTTGSSCTRHGSHCYYIHLTRGTLRHREVRMSLRVTSKPRQTGSSVWLCLRRTSTPCLCPATQTGWDTVGWEIQTPPHPQPPWRSVLVLPRCICFRAPWGTGDRTRTGCLGARKAPTGLRDGRREPKRLRAVSPEPATQDKQTCEAGVPGSKAKSRRGGEHRAG